jgi:hypothetical protein
MTTGLLIRTRARKILITLPAIALADKTKPLNVAERLMR